MMKLMPLIILLATVSKAQAQNLLGAISKQADTVHVEISGKNEWNYDLKKTDFGFELSIEPLNEQSLKSFESFQSPLISKVEVQRQGPDQKNLIKFYTKDASIEVFDYLTDQPSRLILDYFINPQVAQKIEQEKKVKPAPKQIASSTGKTTEPQKEPAPERNPAATDVLVVIPDGPASANGFGLFDGADPNYERFTMKDYEVKEDAIIKSQNNYYIPFPTLRAESDSWAKVNFAPAVYQIKPTGTDENKMARLLLSLFEKKRYNVYLQTLQWFQQKYPKSQYQEILDYVTPEVHLESWKATKSAKNYDQAQQGMSEVIAKYPENSLSKRLSLKRGYLALEKSDPLSALQYFQNHIDSKIDSENKLSMDLANLGKARSLIQMNQFESAVKELDQVIASTKDAQVKAEALYRKGDIFIQKAEVNSNTLDVKNAALKQAVEQYSSARKTMKDQQKQFPNASFNLAEAQFWLDDRINSLDSFRDFIIQFPNHPQVPFALTRVGELLEILGADQSKVMGAFLEAYFRFGDNPNAGIARMRMLAGSMRGMKDKELQNTISQIKNLVEKIDLPDMKQFATVLIADGFRNRGDYQTAIEQLIPYYQSNPTTVRKEMFNKRIVSNINSLIQQNIEKGDFISALKTHEKYAENWLKASTRLDTKYFVGRAFEIAGVENEADKYYREVLNKTYAVRGTKAEKELALLENLPSTDRLNLRLAATNFIKKDFKTSYDFLREIKNPEVLSDEEQIERVELAVKLLEQRGEQKSAIRYLTELLKVWKGQPALVAGPYLQLAKLENASGKTDEAVLSLKKIDQMFDDKSPIQPEVHFKALSMLGEIYKSRNDEKALVQTYEKILGQYEDQRPLGSVRYQLGQIYFKNGDIQKATQVWNDFKNDKSKFWSSLAQEQLKNSEWKDGYKKYIERIPAMSTQE